MNSQLSSCYIPLLEPDTKNAEVPLSCTFYNLRIVKINHFRGSDTELKMAKFFLDTAILLESLILVAAPDSPTDTVRNHEEEEDGSGTSHQFGTCQKARSILVDEMLNWPKASKDAQIIFFEHLELDTTVHPTHTEFYSENICCDI
ncbi:hypothetical protein FRX31_030083 [Thalictrum thalictroides]|uniref:FBD domain-containing protein n=1 Tax=Thalictrum thalictroides TaxID=46969 RepID=A0A7J6V816_THATH|nr:hypothetical protein FRX31_030083 [Thalictrum thalictroides]